MKRYLLTALLILAPSLAWAQAPTGACARGPSDNVVAFAGHLYTCFNGTWTDIFSGASSGTNTGDQTTISGNAGTATTLQNARTINGVSFNGSANITVTAAGSTLSDAVTFANGGIGACAATSATTGTITVNMTTPCVTVTPTGAMTFNASGGVAGQQVAFLITTSGVSSFTLTWGTNFHTAGTLATGTTSARFFAVTFLYDGTKWWEISRTAVQT